LAATVWAVAELAPVGRIFARPEHPYTVGLLGAMPRLDQVHARLASIEGAVPDFRAIGATLNEAAAAK
jgi:peptide/nickel transport system ATP-binding protein